ncbi:MAG: cadherin repeat domain-containing protein, partial [Gammaproteobacteria bacterium]|nr:cadherin repeat domain-containing protein [Gammaproteobacteria bacterium]
MGVNDQTPTATLAWASIANNGTATVQSNEAGTAYLVKDHVSISQLSDITGAADRLWNSVAIGTANTEVNLSVAGLEAGIYKLYATDTGGNLSAASAHSVVVTNTTGNAISLNMSKDENYGQLMAPVYVEGQWYFIWDLNGDGLHSAVQNAAGRYSPDGDEINKPGSGYQYDYATHAVLGGIFTQDVNGAGNATATSDTYRYTTLNGLKLALPTIGEAPFAGHGLRPGTAVDSGLVSNPTYDDLLAIGDAHNGAGTDTNVAGVPADWASDRVYWAATPGHNGHIATHLASGHVSDWYDSNSFYVALQVLSAVTPPATTLSGLDISADTGISASDFNTNTASQTITATLSAALANGEKLLGSVDNGSTWTDISAKVTNTSLQWDGATLAGSSSIQLKVQDAAGNNGTLATRSYVLDTTAPTITSATTATAIWENSGSNQTVYTAAATDGSSLSYSLKAVGDHTSFSINASSGAVILTPNPDYETKNSYAFTVIATDLAGNASEQAVSLAINDRADESPPTAELKTPLSFTSAESVSVDSTESGKAYLVKSTVTVNQLSDITSAADNLWNSATITKPDPVTDLSLSGLKAGVYHLYAADASGNLSARADGSVLVTNTDNNSTIELHPGAVGKLIAPVLVEGRWYAYWDRDGNNSAGLD